MHFDPLSGPFPAVISIRPMAESSGFTRSGSAEKINAGTRGKTSPYTEYGNNLGVTPITGDAGRVYDENGFRVCSTPGAHNNNA